MQPGQEAAALNAGGLPPTDDSALQGWDRLQKLFGYAFARHDPSARLPPMPEELRDWAHDTLLATAAGVGIGGVRQWLEERQQGPVKAPPGVASKAHAARAMAEQQTDRLVRVLNSSVRGGLRVGGLAAVFYAVQTLSGISRGARDFYNTAYGGMAAGAVFGASVHGGSPAVRLRSCVLGAALGASVGVPAGLMHDKLVQLMPEDQRQQRQERLEQTEAIIRGDIKPETSVSRNYDVTAAVIRQLEESLSSSPAQRAAVVAEEEAAAEAGGSSEAGAEAGAGPSSTPGSGRRWWQLWGSR